MRQVWCSPHSGVAWIHPVDVHYGRAEIVRTVRAEVLNAAYARNPERFVNKPPEPAALPAAAWINRPPEQAEDNQTTQSMIP
jgi:putative transposase